MYSFISLGENVYTYILLKYVLNIEYNITLAFDTLLFNNDILEKILSLYKDHKNIDSLYHCYGNTIIHNNKKENNGLNFEYDNFNDLNNFCTTYSIKTYNLLKILSNNKKKVFVRINKSIDNNINIHSINNILNSYNIDYIIITINNYNTDIIEDKYINFNIPFNNDFNNLYNNIINKLKSLMYFNNIPKYIKNHNKNIYFNKLINNLKINNNVNNLDFILNNLITSFSLYFISNHYIGDELEKFNIQVKPYSNNILKHNNIESIKEMDILFVQNNYFNKFISDYLPNIKVNFILITGQWNLPQLHVNEKTTSLLNDSRIIKWFSQNPIFKDKKYVPFPYGLNYGYNLDDPEIKIYAKQLLKINNKKNNNIINLPMNYETNQCRKIFERLQYSTNEEFYKSMHDSKFILSPIGDRNETYRHWEAFGLGTIPISNVGILYKDLYKDNMFYVDNTYDMLSIYNMNIELEYHCPNKDYICLEYWKDYIKNNLGNY